MRPFARCVAAAAAIALLVLPASAGAKVVEGGTMSVPRGAAEAVELRALDRERSTSKSKCPRPRAERRIGRVLLPDAASRPA